VRSSSADVSVLWSGRWLHHLEPELERIVARLVGLGEERFDPVGEVGGAVVGS